MEISLIRHGKSQLIENKKLTSSEFKQWTEKYNRYGVFEESLYPPETLEKIAAAKIVITSDLRRSIDSAKLLNPKVKAVSNPVFREVELPTGSIKLLDVKAKPSNWAFILRILWFSGYSKGCESWSNSKLRAQQASQELIDYAGNYHSVVLVGHGFFNILIAKELQKKGWKGKRKIGSKHWNCVTYSLNFIS
ncbi:phosphoglycerate mutase family protein [Virgibacillus flavescens]|uniref:phosphoglycerate mutase family protein n=1 Tax=Virgibacillus flavescens TaxID=1611422 RepID=UPI003D34DBA1